MSNIDHSPSVNAGGAPKKPRQDVQALLAVLRDAAAECRTEDPCLLMTGFFEHHPLPAWVKALQTDGRFVMMHVNRAFSAATGLTPLDYLGQPDTEFFNESVSATAETEDHVCVLERKTVAIDKCVAHPVKDGVSIRWVGWKWPIMVNGEVVAVCGMAHTSEVLTDDCS